MIIANRFSQAVRAGRERDRLIDDLQGLAPWLLAPEIRRQETESRRSWLLAYLDLQNVVPGSCLVPVAMPHSQVGLRPGTLLPLHWAAGCGDDSRLPPALRFQAEQARAALVNDFPAVRRYGLQWLLSSQQPPPLMDVFPEETLSDHWVSAWLPLAAGLLSAVKGRLADPAVAATGQWNERQGVGSVGEIAAKTQTLMRCYATLESEQPPTVDRDWPEFHTFCVPDGPNRNEAIKTNDCLTKEAGVAPLRIVPMQPGHSTAQAAIGRLVAAQGMEPADHCDDFLELTAYYQWMRKHDATMASDYYRRRLYPRVAEACRGTLGSEPEAMPGSLVAAVSSPALIGIAVELFRIERLLLFYTVPGEDVPEELRGAVDFTQRMQQAVALATAAGCQPHDIQTQAIPFGGEGMRGRSWEYLSRVLPPHVRRFRRKGTGDQLIWECTSGLRVFPHVFEKEIARSGDVLMVLSSLWQNREDNRIPLTEEVILWKHREFR